jgi:hypothetical protein
MIVSAALKSPTGLIYSVPKPGRHHTVILKMKEVGLPRSESANSEQGFLTDTGEFMTREQAAAHVLEVKQIILNRGSNGIIDGERDTLNWPPSLFSEDLW